ncbi:MAG: PIG-L deacetylase family protein, partial [Acidimicrobiia bacterium]
MTVETRVPASALAVYAHPDDPEISAGGTLASWADAGSDVWVLITTRGDKGVQDPDADQDELARVRIDETAKAAALLGFAGHHHLDYSDGELADDFE